MEYTQIESTLPIATMIANGLFDTNNKMSPENIFRIFFSAGDSTLDTNLIVSCFETATGDHFPNFAKAITKSGVLGEIWGFRVKNVAEDGVEDEVCINIAKVPLQDNSIVSDLNLTVKRVIPGTKSEIKTARQTILSFSSRTLILADHLDQSTCDQKYKLEIEIDEGQDLVRPPAVADTTSESPSESGETVGDQPSETTPVDDNPIDFSDPKIQDMLIQGLFGQGVIYPAISHVRTLLEKIHSELRTPSFLVSQGTFPTETLVIYTAKPWDVTYSIMKMKEGAFYRIFVARTNPTLDDHTYVATRHMNGRWTQLGVDIQNTDNGGGGYRRRYR